jgi:hypothetical protein
MRMTRPNTPGYVPAGPAIQVAWDPDDHVFKTVPGGAGLTAELAPGVQDAVNAIAAATTVATLRDAMLDLVEALTGTVAGVEA